MEKEELLKEYEVTLNSLVEKTKFVYSQEFYGLDEFEKQKYTKDKMATEAHLGTLCELLWGENTPRLGGGLSEMFGMLILNSMFGGGFGATSGTDYLKKQVEEDDKKAKEAVFVIPEQ